MCSRTLLGAHHVRLTQMRELTFKQFSLLKQFSFTDIVVSHGSTRYVIALVLVTSL